MQLVIAYNYIVVEYPRDVTQIDKVTLVAQRKGQPLQPFANTDKRSVAGSYVPSLGVKRDCMPHDFDVHDVFATHLLFAVAIGHPNIYADKRPYALRRTR